MRILGVVAAVLGVIGIVVCLVVAVGVWVVRPAVTDKVNEIVAIGTEGLAKADDLAVVASDRLTTVSDRLANIQGTLDTVATSTLIDTAVGQAIRDAVSGFTSGPYAELRSSFAGLRERVVTLSGVVQRLDAAIPGIELPGIVTDAVDDVDARLTQLDQTVASVDSIAGNGVTSKEQVTQLSSQVGEINDVIGAVVPGLETARAQIADAQARLDNASEKSNSLISLLAVVVTIIFIYLALLHVLLYKQGRRWMAREG